MRNLAEQIEKGRDSHWLPNYNATKADYLALQEQMKAQSVSFSQHERLLQQRADLSSEIKELNRAPRELRQVEQEIKQATSDLIALHVERYRQREALSKGFEVSDADIRIEVLPFGHRNNLTQCREQWFAETGLQERDWDVLVQ